MGSSIEDRIEEYRIEESPDYPDVFRNMGQLCVCIREVNM